MSKTPWYDDPNPSKVVRGGMTRGVGLLVSMIALFTIIGAVLWGIKVATSDVKGQGDTTIIKNSADNRIAAQQRFEDLFADIKASDAKLAQAAADAKGGDAVAKTNYTGLVNHCLDTIGTYNAEARKVTAATFRAIDLPPAIDTSDPATDCKESVK